MTSFCNRQYIHTAHQWLGYYSVSQFAGRLLVVRLSMVQLLVLTVLVPGIHRQSASLRADDKNSVKLSVSPAQADSAQDTSSQASAKQGGVAFVNVPRALVYSGPAEEFYPTQQLKQGAAVEVFHRTDSGWAAIRPPQGSFSWVPAAQAFLLPGGRAIEVKAGNAVSWIGTSMGTAKQYRWQVKLQPGEQLNLLGEEQITESNGQQALWYRVSPPSGEFRWIQSGMLTDQPPSQSVDLSSQASVVPASAAQSTHQDVEPAAFQEEIVAQELADGQVVSGDYVEQEYADEGYIIEDGYVEDEGYVIDDGQILDGQAESLPQAHWNDWQLFEFTDEGLRFPLWERALARNSQSPDPLLQDPFSLAMRPNNRGTVLRPMPIDQPMPMAPRRRTPWRDPRMLSDHRMSGYPQASGHRGQGRTLSALQQALGDLQSSGGGQSNLGGYYEPSPNYVSPSSMPGSQPTPRLAPHLEDSSALSGNDSGRGASDFQSSRQSPASLSSTAALPGQTSSGTNWFGLGQSANWSAQPMVAATSEALMRLQQNLSEMVTRPMLQWNFGALKEQTKYFIQNGGSPTERGQARLLMERIESFEQLAMRSGYTLAGVSEALSQPIAGGNLTSNLYGTNSAANYGTVPSVPVIAASYSAGGTASPFGPVTTAGGVASTPESKYDATGWLVPVHAAAAGQPTHAITDDAGQIVAYVTALPGLNLDRYVNQAIGIQGLRGFLPQFQAAHIEAQNIVKIR
ncbi:MAG TPA: hypothetical protein DCF63_15520 [Planctomycetaceae bacterium]|nr:hypothetical protein [Planctomycetaceae bacterium]